MYIQAKDLIGKTFIQVEKIDSFDGEAIKFIVSEDEQYLMRHSQDCCESVGIEDIDGDLSDLVGTAIVEAEERTNSEEPKKDEYDESFTWTFFHFRTIKGAVTIRWYGSSNGYYSESADIIRL